jgi:pimeloyl-ACP methyl ester carboxylesterase
MPTMRLPGPNGTLLLSVHPSLDPSHPKQLFLFLEGWGPGLWRPISPSDRAARRLARRCDVLTATLFLTGIGSPGRVAGLTRADFLRQVLLGYDLLAENPVVAGISAVGTSFGGYLATLLSARRPIDRLVLKVPTDVDPDGFETRPQTELAGDLGLAWKSAPHAPSESLALTAAAAYSGPVWLISAGRDQVVPWQTTRNYLNAFNPDHVRHTNAATAGHAMIGGGRTFDKVLAEAAATPAS